MFLCSRKPLCVFAMPLTPTNSHLPKDFYAITEGHHNIRFLADKSSLAHSTKSSTSTFGTLKGRKVYHVVHDGKHIDKSAILSKKDSRLQIQKSFQDAMAQTLQETIDQFDSKRATSSLHKDAIETLDAQFGVLLVKTRRHVIQHIEGTLHSSAVHQSAPDAPLSGKEFTDLMKTYHTIIDKTLDESQRLTRQMVSQRKHPRLTRQKAIAIKPEPQQSPQPHSTGVKDTSAYERLNIIPKPTTHRQTSSPQIQRHDRQSSLQSQSDYQNIPKSVSAYANLDSILTGEGDYHNTPLSSDADMVTPKQKRESVYEPLSPATRTPSPEQENIYQARQHKRTSVVGSPLPKTPDSPQVTPSQDHDYEELPQDTIEDIKRKKAGKKEL